jgi:hypothetical protein
VIWLNKNLLSMFSLIFIGGWCFLIYHCGFKSEPVNIIDVKSTAAPFLPPIFTAELSDDERAWIAREPNPPPSVLRLAPLSKLPVRLAGILDNGNCDTSIAILEIKKSQSSWACEDISDIDGVSIIHIFPDQITINNNGIYESLILSP